LSTIAETLRSLPYFTDLNDDLLEAVCSRSEEIDLVPDTTLIEEGSLSEEMYVILGGELQVTKKSGSRDVVLATLGPGEVVGEIALLDGAPRTASVVATMPTRLIRVPASAFEELISDSRVVRRMFRTVTARLRGIEESLRHEERMAALGRMAAQLMHELNNPAAAVGRSAASLGEVYRKLGDAAVALAESGVSLAGRVDSPLPPADIDALTRSVAQEDVVEWLEHHRVEDAWDLAPPLVDDGWKVAVLETATEGLDETTGAALVRWIALRCLASQVISEIEIGASRISELVRVVKDYSYLDQAPVQEIDPTAGIADTLVLLKHKLVDVEVISDFASDLARIEAPGRDLNQVWTNLIDNAADAMPKGGTLTIMARNNDDSVVIRIADTGSGIDADTLERIFDPFFTTKEPGKGTGLGLHTVHTIVARAGGAIEATSGPEGTTFTITFPSVAAR
jgi:signal transduction histidine kinase